jgi:hypothetical protein
MFYDELYKPVKNVLNTGYGSTTKFTVRTRPNADLKLEANAERNDKNAIDASLKWTQGFRNRGIGYTVGGKLDVNGTVDVNVNANGVAKGLDLGFDTKLKTDKTDDDNKINVNATYRHDYVSFKTGLEKKFNKQEYLLTESITTKEIEGLTAGVEAKVQVYPIPQKRADMLKELNFGLRYSTANFHVVSHFDNLEKTKIGVAQNINTKLAVAGEFTHNLKEKSNPVWTFGGRYVVDANSTVSAKVNTKGVANVAYGITVNPNITTTLSFETNVNELSAPSKIGVTFDIDA